MEELRMRRPTAGSFWEFSALSRLERTSRCLFLGMVLGVVIISTICLVDAARLGGEPFPGFLVNERMIPSNFGRPHWTGPQAGIRYPDKLRKANDRVLSSRADLETVVRATKIGEPIVYSIERNGKMLQVSIPTMEFTWMDLAMTFGPTFVAGLIYLVITIVVYVLKPDTPVTWAFVLSCLTVSSYQITTFDTSSTHRLVRLTLFLYAVIPAVAVHLSLLFPERSRLVDRFRYIPAVPYVVSALLMVPLQVLYPRESFAPIYAMVRLYLFLSILALLYSAFRAFSRPSSVLARQRAKVVLFGAALAFPVPGIINNLSLLGSTPATLQVLNALLPLPLLLFPTSISYAIAKHNLFDVDVYIKRTVGYAIMTAIVGLGYFFLEIFANTVILRPILGEAADKAFPIVFALLVVFFFHPINQWVQDIVDRMFFRKGYDFKITVAGVGDALNKLADLPGFMMRVIQTVRAQMFLDRAEMILLDQRKGETQAVYADHDEPEAAAPRRASRLGHDDPLVVLLAQEKRLITKYDIAEDPRYIMVRETCEQSFSKLGASLAIPLFYREELAGVFALGNKKSGHFYSREDIDLLRTLSSMTSSAIEQARERDQRATLMQMFSKAVSPEVAEALWQQRDQFLEGGRPRSQKLTVTVLFTDLQGFSGVSEKLDPEVLLDWLNTYMEAITKHVMECGGVVDDYFGDGVKVNFGVPIPRNSDQEIARDAMNAVDCALALEREMVRLNAQMRTRGMPTLRMRVGIYTGPVVAGSLGSADRLKYTTLGDTVNTASRLESFDKDLYLPHLATSPCRILIGESTARYVAERVETQHVGEMTLKGKETKVTAYCVLGRRTSGHQGPAMGQSGPIAGRSESSGGSIGHQVLPV